MNNSQLIKVVVESPNNYSGQVQYTYVPLATSETPGIVAFNSEEFDINFETGVMSLKDEIYENKVDSVDGDENNLVAFSVDRAIKDSGIPAGSVITGYTATVTNNTIYIQFKNKDNNVGDPIAISKATIGLGNVDNTSDANKPISNATAGALENKLDKLDDPEDAGTIIVVHDDGEGVGKTIASSSKKISELVSDVSVSMNSTNYKLTIALKDADGNTVGTSKEVDLPLESLIVSGEYSDGYIILHPQSGPDISIPVSSLVAGLVPDSRTINDHALTANIILTKADIGLGNVENLPVSGKADKVSGATNGDLAGLDANGNLTDSGIKASDVATLQDVEDSKGSRVYANNVFEEEIFLGDILIGTASSFDQTSDSQVPTSLAVKLFVESKVSSGHVYRATIDIKDDNDDHQIFSVIVGTIPTIDNVNAVLVNIPRGEYRAYNENLQSYDWLEVDSTGAVLIGGVVQSSNIASWSISVVQYI